MKRIDIRRRPDVATYQFGSHTAAWAFMRACDASGFQTGFPGPRITVQVEVRTWMDRETIDLIANGAPVVQYEFSSEVAA